MPLSCLGHFIDGCTSRAAQHCNKRGELGLPLGRCAVVRLVIDQGLRHHGVLGLYDGLGIDGHDPAGSLGFGDGIGLGGLLLDSDAGYRTFDDDLTLGGGGLDWA